MQPVIQETTMEEIEEAAGREEREEELSTSDILKNMTKFKNEAKIFERLQKDISQRNIKAFVFYWFKPNQMGRQKAEVTGVYKNKQDFYFLKFKKYPPIRFSNFADLWEFLTKRSMIMQKEGK